MKTTIYRRIRRRPASREAASFKKDNQAEQQFFGETMHEPFFKPVAAGAQSDTVQCKEEKKEEKKVQRAADKKEEEKKVQKKEDKKEEEKVMKKGDKKEEEKKVQRAADKKEEEKKVQKKEDKKEEKLMKKEEKKEEEKISKKEGAASTVSNVTTASNYIGSISGKGQGMDSGVQSFYESKIGADFSDVKIHTGKDAEESAKDINAQAYAYGNHIVFNKDKYQPETSEGKHLLAHELAHVVQQNGKRFKKILRLPGNGEEDGVHAGIAERYRERRGIPASGRDEEGQPVGPGDGEIIYMLNPAINALIAELQRLYTTGGVTQLFTRMRTLTARERMEPEVSDFVRANLAGDELWAANNLLSYGAETSWPVPLRVRREFLTLPGTGGAAAALIILSTATDADKVAVMNDAVTMNFIRALSVTDQQLFGATLVNLTIVPAGNIQAAVARLLFSVDAIDRNTALHIANGVMTVYYIETLLQPPNPAQVVTNAGLSADFTVYLVPPENTDQMFVQVNAVGFARTGTTKLFVSNTVSIESTMNTLVHETNHARNAQTRDTTAAEAIDRYKSEFRAYWVAEFRGVTDLADRARQIKAHILRDYPRIRNFYDTDAAVTTAIDAYVTPDGNITNE